MVFLYIEAPSNRFNVVIIIKTEIFHLKKTYEFFLKVTGCLSVALDLDNSLTNCPPFQGRFMTIMKKGKYTLYPPPKKKKILKLNLKVEMVDLTLPPPIKVPQKASRCVATS